MVIFFCLSFFCLLPPFSGSSSVTKQFTFNKYDYTHVSTYIHTNIHMHASMVYININIHLTNLHTLLYLATRAKEHQCVFGPLSQTPYINIVINIRTYIISQYLSILLNCHKVEFKTTLLPLYVCSNYTTMNNYHCLHIYCK